MNDKHLCLDSHDRLMFLRAARTGKHLQDALLQGYAAVGNDAAALCVNPNAMLRVKSSRILRWRWPRCRLCGLLPRCRLLPRRGRAGKQDNQPTCQGESHTRQQPVRGTPVRYITVHHDGMDPFFDTNKRAVAAHLETIRRLHRRKGWGDIGYHFAVDRAGLVLVAVSPEHSVAQLIKAGI